MTEPNPYAADGEQPEYKWGPTQPPGTPAYGYPNPTPGYGYPNQPPSYDQTQPAGVPVPMDGAPAPMGGQPLVSIGDITVMGDSIVTPAGTLPLRGSVWNATDMSRTEEKIPVVAVVLAPPGGRALDEHVVERIPDGDPEWTTRFLRAREVAEERAFHLNGGAAGLPGG